MTRVDESRALLSDAWVYAYFQLLKADRTSSPLYMWGDMSSYDLTAELRYTVETIEDYNLNNVTVDGYDTLRLEYAYLVGMSVALLRNLLRETGMVVDYYQAFYIALGVYVMHEPAKTDMWRDCSLQHSFDSLSNSTLTDCSAYSVCDWVMLSLMLLAKMRD